MSLSFCRCMWPQLANHDVLSHCMVEEDVDLMNAISELQVVDTKADGYHGYKIVLVCTM